MTVPWSYGHCSIPWSCDQNLDSWQPAHTYNHRGPSTSPSCLSLARLPFWPPCTALGRSIKAGAEVEAQGLQLASYCYPLGLYCSHRDAAAPDKWSLKPQISASYPKTTAQSTNGFPWTPPARACRTQLTFAIFLPPFTRHALPNPLQSSCWLHRAFFPRSLVTFSKSCSRCL